MDENGKMSSKRVRGKRQNGEGDWSKFPNEFRFGTKFVKPISNDDFNFRREFSISAGHILDYGNTYLSIFFWYFSCVSFINWFNQNECGSIDQFVRLLLFLVPVYWNSVAFCCHFNWYQRIRMDHWNEKCISLWMTNDKRLGLEWSIWSHASFEGDPETVFIERWTQSIDWTTFNANGFQCSH